MIYPKYLRNVLIIRFGEKSDVKSFAVTHKISLIVTNNSVKTTGKYLLEVITKIYQLK